jgi:hypothetical protein
LLSEMAKQVAASQGMCHNQPLCGWLLVKISHGKRSMSEKCM